MYTHIIIQQAKIILVHPKSKINFCKNFSITPSIKLSLLIFLALYLVSVICFFAVLIAIGSNVFFKCREEYTKKEAMDQCTKLIKKLNKEIKSKNITKVASATIILEAN